ncbi:MAG: long-chain fatty acid--CoA ligase [Caldilineaceae bacterium]
MATETTLHRLRKNAQTRPTGLAYAEKLGEHWVTTTWETYWRQVRMAGRALVALGIEPGDIVTVLGFNTPEWIIMDLAAMLVGGAATGIYTTNSPAEVAYIQAHSEAKIILLEDEGQWAKVKQVREDLPTLHHVVMMKKAPAIDDPMVLSWEAFLAKGEGVTEASIDARMEQLRMDQLATLIYTSGTTGPPKAVMLSHNNLAETATNAAVILSTTPDDILLSYLPLSHIAEQMLSIHLAICASCAIYFAESMTKVADNLKEVRPTILFGVPRVWDRFYEGVSARMKAATGIRATLGQWAQGVGKQVTALKNRSQKPTGLLALQYRLAQRLVFSKVKEALGLSRTRIFVSAAAPLNPEVMYFFAGLDISIMELYGQSEDCGPTTTNRPGDIRFGTVGKPWPGSEVKLAEDGEILVKGPNVFMGYYKNEEATNKELVDGWLHSGDLGQFDAEGYLTIVGRKKEIMITSGGKNIAPKNIEAALVNCDLIAEAVLVADRRKFVSALLTLRQDAVQKFAEEHGCPEPWHTNPAIVAAVQKEVDEKVNPLFARVEQVRKFTILPRNFALEHDEITPTQKLKRQVVYKNWSAEIEKMYREGDGRQE